MSTLWNKKVKVLADFLVSVLYCVLSRDERSAAIPH